MSSEEHSAGAPSGAEAPGEIPERWSAQRKTELVGTLGFVGTPSENVLRDGDDVPPNTRCTRRPSLQSWGGRR